LRLKSGHAALLVVHLAPLNFAPRASPKAPTVGAWPDFRQQRGDHTSVNRP
jgi:hypothetical protein